MADCVFCKIVAGEIPARVVWSDDEYVAFEDINKQAPVHLVVVPRRHVERLTDLDDPLFAGSWVLSANQAATAAGIAESGYRLVANCNADAGQEVYHLHMHVLGGGRLGGLA